MAPGNMIELDFGSFILKARIFDTRTGQAFLAGMPYRVELERWGGELYGPTGAEFPPERPVPEIPAGGLACSTRGGYLCIFFGQTPAWPVEHIGEMDDGWRRLKSERVSSVTVRRAG